MRAVSLALPLLLLGCAYYEIPLWTDQYPPTDDRVISVEDSPCGGIATVRVRNMLDVRDNPDLESDPVFEVATDGEIKGRWQIPANFQPLGVAGDKLLVDGYWIGRDGSIKPAGQYRLSEPEHRPQCTIPAELDASDYAGCMEFRDLENGATRQLAYQGVCT